jgi:hypothetical protein
VEVRDWGICWLLDSVAQRAEACWTSFAFI